jgi:hypothetical protein
MQFQALRLKVRTLIPIDTEPSQTIEDAFHKFRAIALHIRVFNSQHHRAACTARK